MSFARSYRSPLFLLSVWFLAAALLWAQGPPGLPDRMAIDALGSELFQQAAPTGMVLVAVRGDQVFFGGYGETAPGSHQRPTASSTLRLCSLTKIFTADVLAKLAADGTVRLGDPLQKYAPSAARVPARGEPITLQKLATHTSGLPRELGAAPAGSAHFTYPDFATRWRWLPTVRVRSEPGTAALYSNVGFDLLGDGLQAAAHEPYPALLAKRTLRPLRMYATTFFPSAEQCARLLLGARDEGPCTATEATDGSSGLYSTAADMTSWLRYLLRTDGAGAAAQEVVLLPSDLRSQTGLDHAGEPTGVGLGWIHLLPPDSASHIVEKTGGGAGFQTYIAINHARGTAVFVAATEGSVDTHLNLFNAANKLLLAVAGLPPLPEATTAKAGPNRAPRLHERVREVGLHHGHTRARVR